MKKIGGFFPIIISFFFVYLGYYVCFEKSTQVENPTIYKVIGGISMLFFGILSILGLKKIFSK